MTNVIFFFLMKASLINKTDTRHRQINKADTSQINILVPIWGPDLFIVLVHVWLSPSCPQQHSCLTGALVTSCVSPASWHTLTTFLPAPRTIVTEAFLWGGSSYYKTIIENIKKLSNQITLSQELISKLFNLSPMVTHVACDKCKSTRKHHMTCQFKSQGFIQDRFYEQMFIFVWGKKNIFAVKVQSDQAIMERQCIETLNAAKIGRSWWKTWLPIQWAGRIHFSVLVMARVSWADYVISLHWSAFQPQVVCVQLGKMLGVMCRPH